MNFVVYVLISVGMTALLIGVQEIGALIGTGGMFGDFKESLYYLAIAIIFLAIGFALRVKKKISTPIINYILVSIGLFAVFTVIILIN